VRSTPRHIRWPDDDWAWLKDRAGVLGVSVSSYVKSICRAHARRVQGSMDKVGQLASAEETLDVDENAAD